MIIARFLADPFLRGAEHLRQAWNNEDSGQPLTLAQRVGRFVLGIVEMIPLLNYAVGAIDRTVIFKQNVVNIVVDQKNREILLKNSVLTENIKKTEPALHEESNPHNTWKSTPKINTVGSSILTHKPIDEIKAEEVAEEDKKSEETEKPLQELISGVNAPAVNVFKNIPEIKEDEVKPLSHHYQVFLGRESDDENFEEELDNLKAALPPQEDLVQKEEEPSNISSEPNVEIVQEELDAHDPTLNEEIPEPVREEVADQVPTLQAPTLKGLDQSITETPEIKTEDSIVPAIPNKKQTNWKETAVRIMKISSFILLGVGVGLAAVYFGPLAGAPLLFLGGKGSQDSNALLNKPSNFSYLNNTSNPPILHEFKPVFPYKNGIVPEECLPKFGPFNINKNKTTTVSQSETGAMVVKIFENSKSAESKENVPKTNPSLLANEQKLAGAPLLFLGGKGSQDSNALLNKPSNFSYLNNTSNPPILHEFKPVFPYKNGIVPEECLPKFGPFNINKNKTTTVSQSETGAMVVKIFENSKSAESKENVPKTNPSLLANEQKIVANKTSKDSVMELLKFIQDLKPNNLIDARKIFAGKNGHFNENLYKINPEKHLNKLNRDWNRILHPDKCSDNIKKNCSDALIKLQDAKETLIIYEKIKNLNVGLASYSEIAHLFPFEKGEEMCRRISMLSNEQVVKMLNRFGYGETIHSNGRMVMGSIIKYLNNEQLVNVFNQMNFSQMPKDIFDALFIFCDEKQQKRFIGLLTTAKIKDIIDRHGLPPIWKHLPPEQKKNYIQSLNILQISDNLIINLGAEGIQLFNHEQVKVFVEKFINKYSFVSSSLSSEQFKNFVQSIDIARVDLNLLGNFNNRKEEFLEFLSEKQKEDWKNRFGNERW